MTYPPPELPATPVPTAVPTAEPVSDGLSVEKLPPELAAEVLDGYRRRASLSHAELWLRYFELGGMRSSLELEAYLYGALEPSPHDHDVIAHALNERFVELGGNHPVAYLEGGDDG